MADIIKLARELGAALQADERYEALMQARKTNDEDVELEKLIGEFNLLMLQANQIAEKGDDADAEKAEQINKDAMQKYNEIMANENMQAYQKAQQALEAVVNEVNGIIAMSLNGEDPMTCDPTAANCSHDCSTCGGCH